MNRSFLLLGVLNMLCVSQLLAFDPNPLKNEILNGPVKHVYEVSVKGDLCKKDGAKLLDRCLKKQSYEENIYDSAGILIENGRYNNHLTEYLQVWEPTESSPYVFHGVQLDSRRKVLGDVHEFVAYNPNGTRLQEVHMKGTAVLIQDRYEYNADDKLVAHYLTQGDNHEFLKEAYTYDSLGRLTEYRSFFRPDTLSFGHTFHYTDSVVTQRSFYRKAEYNDDAPYTLYFLSAEGRVIKELQYNHGVIDLEIVYNYFDKYGNWTDKTLIFHGRDSQILRLGDLDVVRRDATMRIYTEASVSRRLRLIEYRE